MAIVIIAIWIGCGAWAEAIAKPKNRAGLGWVLGLLLGVIGVIIVATLPKKEIA